MHKFRYCSHLRFMRLTGAKREMPGKKEIVVELL